MYNNSRDPPSKILLLVITQLPPTFPLTNDYLHQMLKDYGAIKKILIFERGKANKAFIEYYNIKGAIQARKDLNGTFLSQNGGKYRNVNPTRLTIHFSRLKSLDLEVVDNSRGTDYTQPSSTQSDEPEPIKCQTLQLSQKNSSQSQVISDQEQSFQKNSDYLDDSDDESSNPFITPSIWRTDNQYYIPEVQQILQQKPSKIIKIVQVDDRVTAKMIFNLFCKFGYIEELLYEKQFQRVFIRYFNQDNATIAKEYLNNVLFFDSQLRIYYHPVSQLQPTSLQDEYMIYYQQNGPNGPKQVVPLSLTLQITGISDSLDIIDMFRLVGKINDYKFYKPGSLILNMINQYEALKIIAVFSDYEYKNSKLQVSFK